MLNTLKIFEDLKPTVGPEAAEKFASVIGAVYEELHNTVTKADFAELRAVIADSQKRTDEHLATLDLRMAELAEAQKRTESRVTELTEAQQRTEQRIIELVEAQKQTHDILMNLLLWVKDHEDRLTKLDGRTLELQFRQKASAYLGRVMRATRVVPAGDLGDDMDGVLSEEEWAELIRTDVILRGRAVIQGERREVYAVVQVSVTLDRNDVTRAARRAGLLRKKGWPVLAVAAGEKIDPQLLPTAAQLGVAVLLDGEQSNWPEALAAA